MQPTAVFKPNPIFLADFYKTGHIRQYPLGTTLICSNLTPRSKHYSKTKDFTNDLVVVVGLYPAIVEIIALWNEHFFSRPKEEVLSEGQYLFDKALGEGSINMQPFGALHDYGRLPITISALPEGTLSKTGIPVMTIHNTQPEFYWVTNYLETILSAESWKPITAATIAYAYRAICDHFALITGDDDQSWFVDFQCHDFSMRGMSGWNDAVRTGIGHLASFKGSDTIGAIQAIEHYYQTSTDHSEELVGCSVSASEHSVMAIGGDETEQETIRRLIQDVYPEGIVSIVSDTWDYWQTITTHATALKDIIMARPGKVVFRPDSGDPVDIICGTAKIMESYEDLKAYWLKVISDEAAGFMRASCNSSGSWFFAKGIYYQISDNSNGSVKVPLEVAFSKVPPEVKGSIEVLAEIFGTTTNSRCFKTLDQHVGLIYGDSITLERCETILGKLLMKGYAFNNVVFGVGSYTYNLNSRDSLGFAVKATYGEINGQPVDIQKSPKTDPGKKSAKGLISVKLNKDHNFSPTIKDGCTWEEFKASDTVTVVEDGIIVLGKPNWTEVCNNVKREMPL